MKLNDDIVKRFKEVSHENGLSIRQFAESLGCPPSTLQEIYAGRIKTLPESILANLETNFNINQRWLETGRCPKYKRASYKSTFKEQGLLGLVRLLCKEKRHMLPSFSKISQQKTKTKKDKNTSKNKP